MQAIIGALGTPSLVRAPYVDFEDVDEFQALCSSTALRYARLIARVVDSHMQNRGVSKFEWSKTDEMLMGVSNFPELRRHGVAVLLRLTHKRGLGFVLSLNNTIVMAVTVACRTCCDVHRESMVRDLNNGRSESLTAHYVRDVKRYMVRALLLIICNVHTGDAHSPLNSLFRQCFASMHYPPHNLVYIPRHRVREYVLALACITHARLGCGADGAPLMGQCLQEDTLRMIVGFIDFH
jgi:hypothetical protein